MALFIDVGPGDALRIGDSFITVERKSGSRARLRIVGRDGVELLRDHTRDDIAVQLAASTMAAVDYSRAVNQRDEE